MGRIERNQSAQSGAGRDWLDSPLVDIAREILPEGAKKLLRQVVYGEKVKYPLQKPLTVRIGCAEARFWIRNSSDWYRIARQDFEGEYASRLINTVASMESPKFIDVGSAQGYYSILAAKAGAKVAAFDPDPVSQQSMADNLSINGDVEQQIHTHAVALGNQESQLIFYIDRSGTYAPSFIRTVRGLKEEIHVPVTTMDIMIANGLEPPDIVKIDVEGAEGLVLAGMKYTLTSERKPQHIFIELHRKYLPRFGSSADEVQHFITECGYNLEGCWRRRSELLCHYELLG